MSDDHITFFVSAVYGGYTAGLPALTCCSAFGATPEEALAEALKAKSAWLEAAHATGKPVPLPAYRPAIYQVT